jgi:hypothetical protein
MLLQAPLAPLPKADQKRLARAHVKELAAKGAPQFRVARGRIENHVPRPPSPTSASRPASWPLTRSGLPALLMAASLAAGDARAGGPEIRKCGFEVKARCASGEARVILLGGVVQRLEVDVATGVHPVEGLPVASQGHCEGTASPSVPTPSR